MVPADTSQLNTLGNGGGDNTLAVGVIDVEALIGETGLETSSGGVSKSVQPARLQLAQTDGALPATEASSASAGNVTSRVETAAPATPGAGGEQASSLQLAPIRFWGDIGYELRRETIESQKYVLKMLTTKINASTFIWRPWFAQVSGGLGFATSTSDSASGNNGTNFVNNATNFVTGNAALNLLPFSRFPLELHFDRSDSRLNTGPGTDTFAYRTTRYGLTQRYRPLAGDTQYLVGYDHNRWQSSYYGEDKQELLRLEMTKRLAHQTLQINGNVTKNDRPQTDEHTTLDTLVVRHSYKPSSTVSMENLASMTRTNYRLTQGKIDFRNQQLSSFTFWHPVDKPLTVTGGARLFGMRNDNGHTTQAQGASASLGGNYELSRHTRLNGNLNASVTETSGARTVTSSQSTGLAYQSDGMKLGAFRYTRFASAAVANRNDPVNSGQHLGLQLGHSLNRSMELGGGTLGTSLSQTVSSGMDSRIASILRLSNSGALTWSRAKGRRTTFIRLSINDTRAVKGNEDVFQLVNLQASRSESMSRNASWAGNLTIQATRQRTGTTPTSTTATTSSADLSYRQQHAFGVRRLSFVSELRIYGDMPVPVLASPRQQETRSWENRLDYPIGRLRLRFIARISEVNKQRNSLLMLTLNRQFGNH